MRCRAGLRHPGIGNINKIYNGERHVLQSEGARGPELESGILAIVRKLHRVD